jgi:AcrR family transcriptional regulator
MQYLKDEVRNNIAEKALIEFREKGYKGASVRAISKNSGTSVGNMYKYFQSKEDLYETLIGSVYNQVMSCMSQFRKVELNQKSENIFYELMENILEIVEESSAELSILLNKSEGSKYENCKITFIDLITNIVTEMMKYELSTKGRILKNNFIIYLLSYNLVESIALILRSKEEGTEIRKLILNIIDIFYGNIGEKLESEEML